MWQQKVGRELAPMCTFISPLQTLASAHDMHEQGEAVLTFGASGAARAACIASVCAATSAAKSLVFLTSSPDPCQDCTAQSSSTEFKHSNGDFTTIDLNGHQATTRVHQSIVR
jgi:hypothetical protein